jgi:GNAT superfamily N-acetyltransferase
MLRYQDPRSGFWQYFYEPINTFEALVEITSLNLRLAGAGAPDWARNEMHLGFKAFDSIYRAEAGHLTIPGENEPLRGRHFVRVLGCVGDEIVFLNSWSQWGDQGRGYMPREYFERYVDYADVARTVGTGLTRSKSPLLMAEPDLSEWRAIWMLSNERRESRYVRRVGLNFSLVTYETIAYEWGCPVDIVEIWEPSIGRFAWSHIYHRTGYPRTSAVREFFVAPHRRRQGWGTILEDEVRTAAKRAGSQSLTIDVGEADRLHGAEERARGFLEARGYSWADLADTKRPVLIARGVRKL